MRKATTAQVARKREIKRNTLKIFVCAICRKSSRGVGHSAWPTVPDGTCCDKCHEEYGARPAPLEECFKAWGMEWATRILQAGGA